MSKRRCSVCREYFPKEEMLAAYGLTAVCSEECLQSKNIKASNARLSKPATRTQKTSSGKKRTNPRSKDRVPAEVAEAVLAREGRRCRFCGGLGMIQIHHVRYRSEGIDHRETNLLSVCRDCHDRAHSNKKLYQPLLLEVLRLQYEEGRKVTVLELERAYKRG